MASVGFCVVTTAKRGYPLEDATHIALSKTLRKMHTHSHEQLSISEVQRRSFIILCIQLLFLYTNTHTWTHTLADNCLGN